MKPFVFHCLLAFLLGPFVLVSQDISVIEADEYQDEDVGGRVFLLEGNLNLTKPLGQFYWEDQGVKFGFGFNMLTQVVKEKSLMMGLDFVFNIMDSNSGEFMEVDDEGFVRDFSYNTNSHMTMMLLNTRYYFDFYLGKFNPYVEALVGGKIMTTVTRISDLNDEDFSDSDWDKFSYSSSYGMSIGTHYEMSPNMFLDVRARYLLGSTHSYYVLDENRRAYDIGIDNFKLDISKTDLIYYTSGVVFKF